MSGHSKWAQIKHKKAVTDVKRGQLFSKMVKEISVATRSGGADPKTNPRLRAAVEKARLTGLPKENIARAMERASGKTEDGKLQEFLYEATAPRGVSLIIEVITDNKNRSLAEIKQILNKFGAKIADPGTILWNFEKVGVIKVEHVQNPKKPKEDMELIIIESGAKDLQHKDNSWVVETNFQELEVVRKNLEERGLKTKEVLHLYKPKMVLSPGEETQKNIESLSNELCAKDDVQAVYTNLET